MYNRLLKNVQSLLRDFDVRIRKVCIQYQGFSLLSLKRKLRLMRAPIASIVLKLLRFKLVG
jgi:hypothetical protein